MSEAQENYQIRWLAGPLTGQETPVHGMVSIGRDPGNDITLPVTTQGVSRRHCMITLENGVICITDLGSAFGTVGRTGGDAIHRLPANQAVIIQPGDVISLGSDQVVFTIEKARAGGFASENVKPERKAGKKSGKVWLIIGCIAVLLIAALAVCYKMGIIQFDRGKPEPPEETAAFTETSEPPSTPEPDSDEASSTSIIRPSTETTEDTAPTPTPMPAPTPTPTAGDSTGEDAPAGKSIKLAFGGNRYNAGLWSVPVLEPAEEIHNCTGFTLCFRYDKVDTQELGTQRVYVSLNQSNGAWLECGTMDVEKQGEVYRKAITFDKPRTVGGIAVLSKNATESGYQVTAWLEDLEYNN